MFQNLRELYQYRALLFTLIGRDLKVRYRGSALGFFWTFLNPLILMIIYTLVFSVYMRSGVPNYAYFMLSGLLPWLWFTSSIGSGTSAISDRRDLISKVKFPPQILAANVIGASLINYLLSLPLLMGLALYEHIPLGRSLIAFPLIVLVQLVLTSGIVFILATANVMFRDLQHIVPNILSFLFFLTPVIYPLEQIPEKYRHWALMLNPMATLVTAYHDIFVDERWPSFRDLGLLFAVGLLLYAFGSSYMGVRREDFAEAA